MNIGVLAYGSLIDNPGTELSAVIVSTLRDVKTPFPVEYARSSAKRGGAPTLIPVTVGGAQVNAAIHVLKDSISVEEAMNLVWRRETGKYGPLDRYRPTTTPGVNTVQVLTLPAFHGVNTVLYTRIGPNIAGLTGEELARRAIASAQSRNVEPGDDGISYLTNNERNQIVTPLTNSYKQAILRLTGCLDLHSALTRVRGSSSP